MNETKHSPFLSLFRKKKKVNSAKDVEELPSPRKQNFLNKENKRVPNSHTMPIITDKKKNKESKKKGQDLGKSHSMDAILEDDAAVLVEALETMGDEKPNVARSIPKHAKIVQKEDKTMKNCLFEKEVYDSMLSDSLRVCEMLQSHLDDCIVSVRAKSPEPSSTYSQDGRDSGRGASSPSSTLSTSPTTTKRTIRAHTNI